MKIRKAEKTEAGTGEISMEYAEQTFKELLAFQGYGFCFGYDVPVFEKRRGEIPIGQLHVGDSVLTPGDSGGERWEEVLNVILQGRKDVFRVEFSNGRTLNITLDHPLLCEDGVLRDTRQIMDMRVEQNQCINVMFRGLEQAKIVSVTYLGMLPVLDITISGRNHLFYANGCIVHNCKAHAASYSVYSAVQMWLQEHYFDEYMCALLRHVDRAKEKKGVGVLNERVEYCVRHGMSVHYPDVMSSTDKWELTPGGLLAPLKNIKGFSDREVRTIVDGRPYRDLPDFLDRTKFNKNRFEALLFSHALRRFGSIPDLYEYYYNVYAVKDSRPAKKEQSVDLFAMFGGEPEQQEESSAAPRVQFPYNSGDIDEKCLDYNGFVIPTNVRAKYHEFFEKGMKKVAELKHDDSYNNKRNRICTLEEASDPQQRKDDEVKKDGYMSRWILAKVVKVARNIPGKWGTFSKMTVSDGYDSKDIFCNSSLSSRLKKGVVAVMPVSVSKETGRMYFDSHTNDNHELVILEEPQ